MFIINKIETTTESLLDFKQAFDYVDQTFICNRYHKYTRRHPYSTLLNPIEKRLDKIKITNKHLTTLIKPL